MPPHKAVGEAAWLADEFFDISIVGRRKCAVFCAVVWLESRAFAHIEQQVVARAVELAEDVESPRFQALWDISAVAVEEHVYARERHRQQALGAEVNEHFAIRRELSGRVVADFPVEIAYELRKFEEARQVGRRDAPQACAAHGVAEAAESIRKIDLVGIYFHHVAARGLGEGVVVVVGEERFGVGGQIAGGFVLLAGERAAV